MEIVQLINMKSSEIKFFSSVIFLAFQSENDM
jgi:hypothetical protein